jgi:hypothetical protein
MFVSETYTEVLGIQAAALGVLPVVARWTYDNYHTSAYALGYMAEKIQPRIAVASHWEYDVQQANEVVAEVREHYKGPFAFGAPGFLLEWPMKEVITMPMPDSMVDPKYKKK